MPWQKSSYSPAELSRMRQEADMRAEKMWRSAAPAPEAADTPAQEQPQPPCNEKISTEPPQPTRPRQQNPPMLSLDSDRLLIIALILLLVNEKCDSKLILALLWLML